MSIIETSVKSIEQTIAICLKNNLTFAAYRLPNKKEQFLIVQKDSDVEIVKNLHKVTSQKGFFIAPFAESETNKMLLIKPDYYFKGYVGEEDFKQLDNLYHPADKDLSNNTPIEISKEEYLNQIEEIADAIGKDKIQKAVLSRIKVVNNKYHDFADIFTKLCERFPNAFVYVFRAKENFWMGATPEPFAFLQNNTFQTSSVAGTKENTEKYQSITNWGDKEKQEQKYVSDHIDLVLKNAHWENTLHQGPYVKAAGNLLHLRTDFTANTVQVNGNIGEMLHILHPTPAICGFPTKEALDIINNTEKHDREFYGGFLGPIGMDNPLMLFVNLRCMKITRSNLFLYSGGGITIDSIPEDEWYETEIKTGTLLSVIRDIQ